MLLRSGRSLFESLGYGTVQFDQDRAVAGRQVTHIRYRIRYGHFSDPRTPSLPKRFAERKTTTVRDAPSVLISRTLR